MLFEDDATLYTPPDVITSALVLVTPPPRFEVMNATWPYEGEYIPVLKSSLKLTAAPLVLSTCFMPYGLGKLEIAY